ncbi:poly-beta-hydroxybutyrate polymerase N-terminal domain-containing protein [Paraburkholderia bengalensis]|uniref:Poly-beta-hydroxybutyrate polymerase N-terminal domain-containing protein n=2 Tax=Paraburkholderia bengalensis TaxID=2747562 RepID=A0ABU8J2B5_9BURK
MTSQRQPNDDIDALSRCRRQGYRRRNAPANYQRIRRHPAAHACVAALTGGFSLASVALAFMDWMLTYDGRTRRAKISHPKTGRMQDDSRFASDAWLVWPFHVHRDGFLRPQRAV